MPRALKITLQLLALLPILLGVTIVTLHFAKRDNDGPSILFPGGALVSGELHVGADPDWSFTDDVFTIELQLDEPLASRRIFVMEFDGRIYVPSGYMHTMLGRLWKDWAFHADEGDGLAVARIEGTRYERRLVRVTEGPEVEGVARKLAMKYAGGASPETVSAVVESIERGETWIFELAPRGAAG